MADSALHLTARAGQRRDASPPEGVANGQIPFRRRSWLDAASMRALRPPAECQFREGLKPQRDFNPVFPRGNTDRILSEASDVFSQTCVSTWWPSRWPREPRRPVSPHSPGSSRRTARESSSPEQLPRSLPLSVPIAFLISLFNFSRKTSAASVFLSAGMPRIRRTFADASSCPAVSPVSRSTSVAPERDDGRQESATSLNPDAPLYPETSTRADRPKHAPQQAAVPFRSRVRGAFCGDDFLGTCALLGEFALTVRSSRQSRNLNTCDAAATEHHLLVTGHPDMRCTDVIRFSRAADTCLNVQWSDRS